MFVKDLMTTNVVSVGPDTSVNEVADILHQKHFTGVPVVDKQNVLLGVIMERDFITSESKLYLPTYIKLLQDVEFNRGDKKFVSDEANEIINAKAKDIMNTQLVTARPETNLQELAELFATKRVNPIPVIDNAHKLVGVISRSDLIKLFSPKHIDAMRESPKRWVDKSTASAHEDIIRKFTLVARTRVSIWFLISILFFAIGFVVGQAWLVNVNG